MEEGGETGLRDEAHTWERQGHNFEPRVVVESAEMGVRTELASLGRS